SPRRRASRESTYTPGTHSLDRGDSFCPSSWHHPCWRVGLMLTLSAASIIREGGRSPLRVRTRARGTGLPRAGERGAVRNLRQGPTMATSALPLSALIELSRSLRHYLGAGLSLVDVFRQQAKRGPAAVRPV